jgi:hypothetical protein
MAEVALPLLGKNMLGTMEQQRDMMEQLRGLTEKVDLMQDDITVLTGMTMRVDAALQGLVAEMRGLHHQQTRLGRADVALDERVTDVEVRVAALEERLPPE